MSVSAQNDGSVNPVASEKARSPRRAPWVMATLVVLGLLVAIAAVALIVDQRRRTMLAADHELRRLALTMATEAEQGLEPIDVLETALLDRLQAAGLHSLADLRRLMADVQSHEDLRNRQITLTQLDAIHFVDANGDMINSSRFWPLPSVNVSDRAYFQALKTDPDRTTLIGEPVRTRVSDIWTLFQARRINGDNNQFLGIILASVPISYFQNLYQTVSTGPDNAIALFRTD